jgi:hypothetical protein
MGDLAWKRRGKFVFPKKALRYHAVALGSTGSGKSVTLARNAYGAHKVYHQQVIQIDAKGETKREDEASEDNAARFVATMQAAGAKNVLVFPSLHYNGWHGTPAELKNRLLSVIDYSESAFYGDVAANALDLALSAPTTPHSSQHFLANLRYDRLKAIYANNPLQYQRVLALDKHLLAQVEMRYQVFFSAMNGQLDGTLDYANADAVYLRVRGFTLRAEAPRLGRFLVSDFMHYIAERRRSGVRTLFIIDEFNALRMREETSILFEQVRDFGGSLIISAQGYAGLGPHEYAERILDACSTYILHSCSDPGPVSRRAGKKLYIDTLWSEDAEGNQQKQIRPRWDWRVPETAVMQQEEGQAFWIYKGRAQHVQTAPVPITPEQVNEGWREIRRQEDIQRQLLELEERRRKERQAQKQQNASTGTTGASQKPATSGAQPTPRPGTQKKSNGKGPANKKAKQQPTTPAPPKATPKPEMKPPTSPPPATKASQNPTPDTFFWPDPTKSPATPEPRIPPAPDPDDDEPDRL